MADQIRQAVLISDTHVGCQLALMSRHGADLDEGGMAQPNAVQERIAAYWDELWQATIPALTEDEPWVLVHLGDVIDGTHHHSTHQWSANVADQKRHAVEILRPVVESPRCQALYVIRGTEAHTAPSARDDEEIAAALGSVPNRWGRHTRYQLRLRLGDSGLLVCQHHVGTTSSAAYATSAPFRALAETYVRAARWGTEPPDVLAFGHRHQHVAASFVTAKGRGSVVCCPGWQALTPFARKVAGQSVPEFGAVVVRWNRTDGCYMREHVWPIVDDEIEGC